MNAKQKCGFNLIIVLPNYWSNFSLAVIDDWKMIDNPDSLGLKHRVCDPERLNPTLMRGNSHGKEEKKWECTP